MITMPHETPAPRTLRGRPSSRTSLLACASAAVLLASCTERSSPFTAPEPPSFNLVRITWPSAAYNGPPAYTRIEPFAPHIYHDGTWAVIVFYRDPECIPADFNLLLFADFAGAATCDLTVEGAAFWPDGNVMGPPKMATATGTGAVPVWFVPVVVIQAALQDGELTIAEVAGLEGLLAGVAERFHETLQPLQGPHPRPKLIMNAHGHLDDGSRFNLHVTSIGFMDKLTVGIQFRSSGG